MNGKKVYGVITGDLIKSVEFRKSRNHILLRLKEILLSAPGIETHEGEFILFSDIFRGDSFQGILSKPSSSLKIALFIQTQLSREPIGGVHIESRLGIGFGTVDFLDKDRIVECDGVAFRLSGQALDQTDKYRRLTMLSPSEEMNRHLNIMSAFLDAIMQRWSQEQAEAISFWLQGYTQESIAHTLGIKQPAVHQRLQLAGHFAIKEALEYFSWLTDKYDWASQCR